MPKKKKKPTNNQTASRKRNMRRGRNRGSAFERDVCKRLSLWWSEGEKEDVFWRSTTSGARATQTGLGQYGDVCAIDPMGNELLDHFVIELKTGYVNNSLQDMIDRPNGRKPSHWEQWITKCEEEVRKHSTAKHFMIISRRKSRELIVLTNFNYVHFESRKGGLVWLYDDKYQYHLLGDFLVPDTKTIIQGKLC